MPDAAVPAHVINLDHRGDRLARMAARLDALGIAWRRLPAFRGAGAPEAALMRAGPASGPIGPLSPGTRACTISHLSAWAALLDEGAPHALILEDDVILADDLARLLPPGSWWPEGAHVVKLEKFPPGRPSRLLLGRAALPLPCAGRTVRRMHSRHTASGGYLISREGARIGLAHGGRIDVPIDHFLFNDTVSPVWDALRPHLVTPAVLRQADSTESDIWAATDPRPDRAARRRVKLRRGLAEVSGLPRQIAALATGRARVVEHVFRE